MRRAIRVTAIGFIATMAIAAACKGKDEVQSKPTVLGDAMPSLDNFLDAEEPKKRSVNANGWLLLDPGGEERTLVSQAIAKLQATNGSQVEGTIRFAAADEGVIASLDLKGLIYLSKYTLRIHMLGDCSAADGSSAGPSFSFDGSSLNPPQGNGAGLLGEISAAIGGEAKGDATIAGPAIQGPYTIVGRSIALHAAPDALSGAAEGKMLACGVIGIFADVRAPAALGDL